MQKIVLRKVMACKDRGHVCGTGADADRSSAGWPGLVCLKTWDGCVGVPRGRELGVWHLDELKRPHVATSLERWLCRESSPSP